MGTAPPNVRSMSETKSAIRSSDLHQKISAPIAAETAVKATSIATKYAAKYSTERPSSSSSCTFCTVRCGIKLHETASVQGVWSLANSLGMPEMKTPTYRSATTTHATRTMGSQRPRRVVDEGEALVLIPPTPGSCSLILSVTTTLYSTIVSQALRQTLRGKGLNNINPHHQPRGHGGPGDGCEVRDTSLSPSSVSVVNTLLIPSESDEDGF